MLRGYSNPSLFNRVDTGFCLSGVFLEGGGGGCAGTCARGREALGASLLVVQQRHVAPYLESLVSLPPASVQAHATHAPWACRIFLGSRSEQAIMYL